MVLPVPRLALRQFGAYSQRPRAPPAKPQPIYSSPTRPLAYHPPLPSAAIELYFDIEAEPDRNLDFLLGVLVVNHRTGTERFHAFLAEDPSEEPLIWQQFLALLLRYPGAPVFHFAAYEVDTVKRLAALYKTAHAVLPESLDRFVDIHAWVTQSVAMPVENYSLKTLAKWLGFAWRDADASGDQTVCWYDRWLRQGDRQLLNAIVRYNEDDCRATYRLKQWLGDFLASASEPPLAVNS
ncbi:MAG: TM0106 family RecB-like putative nuclease [Spirulinaceae cyanobacterium RM2_2_10]|nr:TM0106 family RecB-like putative nuclease [Spirulinaceae cyanobacterium RM2_2_10]